MDAADGVTKGPRSPRDDLSPPATAEPADEPTGATTQRQGLLRNVLWAGGGSVLVKPVWILFIVALCPRVLGVEGFGAMQSALALAGIALTLADLGTSTYTLREVSARPSRGAHLFSNVLVLRVFVGTVCVAGALAVAGGLEYDGPGLFAVAAAGSYLLAQQVVGFTRVFFRVAEDLRYEAVSTVAERGAVIVLGAAMVLLTGSPGWTIAGMAAGAAVVGVGQVRWISRTLVPFSRGEVGVASMRQVAWFAVPLGLADLFLALYSRVDLVMVEALSGSAAAGQYGQAYRLFEALSLLPAIVVQSALFPKLSRLVAAGAREEARRLTARTGTALVAAGVGVAGLVWAAAPLLIKVLTGDGAFAPAATALRILVWTFPLVCIKDLLFISSLAHERYRGAITIFGFAVAFNVGLNLWAIPRYGIAGASWATFASEVFAVAMFAVLALRRSKS